jgi:ribonuclease Z
MLLHMLHAQVLGQPAHDNALLVTATSGQGHTKLLLDCGENVLAGLSIAEIADIDHLLFSHFHMDHVSGFDAFFRVNFERVNRENHLWGPPGSIAVLGHRFQGYWWNLTAELSAVWHVHEVTGDTVSSARFEAREGFAVAHDAGTRSLAGGPLISTPEVQVQALVLSHHGVSLGYVLREPQRHTVDKAGLQRLGLSPGPWLAQLKTGATGPLDVNGTLLNAGDLRAELLRPVPGESLAYLSDFLLNDSELARLSALLTGVGTLYTEAQYAPEDVDRASRNHHTTALQVAELARRAAVQQLNLLHLSRRYSNQDWAEWLQAARAIFPATQYPAHWFGEGLG